MNCPHCDKPILAIQPWRVLVTPDGGYTLYHGACGVDAARELGIPVFEGYEEVRVESKDAPNGSQARDD